MNTKYVIRLMGSLFLLFSLWACGGEGETSSTGDTQTNTGNEVGLDINDEITSIDEKPIVQTAIGSCDAIEIVAEFLNVRINPNTQDAKIDTINRGEQYVVVGSDGNWVNIWFDEQTRWVYGPTYTKRLDLPCGKVINTNALNVRVGKSASTTKVGTAIGGSLWVYTHNEKPDENVIWKNIWYKGESRFVHANYLAEEIDEVVPPVINVIVTIFNINETAAITDSIFVSLKSKVNVEAAYYQVSEHSSFTGASWMPYKSTVDFTLSTGDGDKKVFFRVKNEEGRLSEGVSAGIKLQVPVVNTSNRQIDRSDFYAAYRSQFGSLNGSQVTGLNYLLSNFENDKESAYSNHSVWLRQISYLLATTKHEVANTYAPITEYGSTYCARYDGGCTYKGRGYVQLTHKYNYKAMSSVVNADLVSFPTRALEPNIAYTVMSYGSFHGIFTTRKLGDYIKVGTTDYYNARRVINGTDKASLIKGYAQKFQTIMSSSSQ